VKSTCVFVVWLSLSLPAPVAAQNMGAVLALYDDIGRSVAGVHDAFETVEASDAGLRVLRELRSAGKLARRQAALARRPR